MRAFRSPEITRCALLAALVVPLCADARAADDGPVDVFTAEDLNWGPPPEAEPRAPAPEPPRAAARPAPAEAAPERAELPPLLPDDVMAALRAGDWARAAGALRTRVAGAAGRLAAAAHARAREAGASDDSPGEIARALARSAVADLLRADVQLLVAQAFGVLFVVALTLRSLRGCGDLAVCIEYPSELRGTFTVRLARRRSPAHARRGRITSPVEAQRAIRQAGASRRNEHPLVSRETQFRDQPARRYWVQVDGFLQGAEGDSVLATHFEEQEVRVRRRGTVRVEFDFHPRQTPLDVRVLWDKRPVNDARVAVRGDPSSVRFSRNGRARLALTPGPHTLVVGSGDRVAERAVDIDSFQPGSVEIDLTGRDNVLFSGCPPAVEPYLHGDVPAAARALEREGQSELSHLLLARFHQEREQPEAAARHYEQAARPREAAELREAISDFERSAALFEEAGEAERAAEMYRSAGDLARAGDAYERALRFDSAIECFREVEDVPRWVGALEKSGATYEAAKVALEKGDIRRAIHALQQLPYDDPDYAEASNLLVELYEQGGHLDLAAHKVEEIIRTCGADAVPLATCDRLAQRLEDAREFDRALDMLEIIRRRDATWPKLGTRIDVMRKQKAGSGKSAGPGFEGARYEILEELGRGGMGIVFKARDRRLGRVVALKRLPDDLRNHPNAVKLFLREARAAAALNHTNIVTLFDAGQEGDTYYLTMELLEGSPLHRILRQRGRLSARNTAQLGIQVANGLQYAHDQRIVHRDIKTANLFLTRAKSVKIMDFGLAKMVEEVRRASTLIGGTPYYMAPEQSVGDAVDHRADLYALGITFFELLTGKVPFRQGDVAMHHRHTPPPDPRRSAADLPDALADLVLEMLAKAPADRIASAALVVERLQAILRSLG